MGVILYDMRKSFEFLGVIEAYGLTDLGFHGHNFTWSNIRGIHFIIWKILNRAMVSDAWLREMAMTNITHFSSVFFDHYPLLLEMQERVETNTKYFKFLDCLVEHPTFLITMET